MGLWISDSDFMKEQGRTGILLRKLKVGAIGARDCHSSILMLFITTKWLHRDVTMDAVHFWGQERGLLVGREWLKKKVCQREKGALALRWNMEMQTVQLVKW